MGERNIDWDREPEPEPTTFELERRLSRLEKTVSHLSDVVEKFNIEVMNRKKKVGKN